MQGDEVDCSIIFPNNSRYLIIKDILKINGREPKNILMTIPFKDRIPIFPNERIKLSKYYSSRSNRILDLITPLG